MADLPQVGKSLLRTAMRQRPEGTRMSASAVPQEKTLPFPQGFPWNPRILKLARTIADPSDWLRMNLAGSDSIDTAHLAKALQYRPRRQT